VIRYLVYNIHVEWSWWQNNMLRLYNLHYIRSADLGSEMNGHVLLLLLAVSSFVHFHEAYQSTSMYFSHAARRNQNNLFFSSVSKRISLGKGRRA
jgi:hypothetical protein